MILHIDMDAFYASVEQRDRPELKGRCVIVGGKTNRGVVAAASYEARAFGVHSAMPIFQARRICPDAVYVSPRRDRYLTVSRDIMSILRTYSPLVETVSIDEAFVDITGCGRLHGDVMGTITDIKGRILAETQLTCSVGGAPVKFLAKIASDMDKPDGQYVVWPAQMPGFIDTLPIEKVPGVGKKTAAHLGALHIRTLGDVKRFSADALINRLGKFGYRLADLAAGIDRSRVTPGGAAKSISSEVTLPGDTADRDALRRHMLDQAEEVGRQLRKKGLRAKAVTIKVKHADFKLYTRRVTLPSPTQSARRIYRAATALLGAYSLSTPVRLIGVGVSGFLHASAPTQMDLFAGAPRKNANWEKVDKAVDSIERKFGKGSVKKARLVDDPGD